MSSPYDSRERALSVRMQGVKSLVSELLMEWPDDVPFNARQVLAEHPELQACKSAVVDVVYEEFCRRQEAGEKLDPYQVAQEFPDVRSSLLHLMQVHDFVRTESQPRVWPQPGTEFLGFYLLEELGKGAFSRVFLAEELDLGSRLVVVKVTTLGRNEAHTLGQLQHPHIVPIHSVKTDPALGFTVVCMPFLGRATLFDVADAAGSPGSGDRRASLILEAATAGIGDDMDPIAPGAEAPFGHKWSYVDGLISLAAQIADGLAYTHDRKFLHCDIKPSNILVTESGRALLFDFNLAFLEDETAALAGGTIPYMAPEQLLRLAASKQGPKPAIDARTDIYCLGATLYELLTGRFPFGPVPVHLPKDKLVEHQMEKRRQPGLSWDGVQVEPRLARIVETCLAFLPEQRFQSAQALAQALRRELTWPQRARRWVSLHRRIAAAVLSAAISLSGVTAYQMATREPVAVREYQSAWSAYRAHDYRESLAHLDRLLTQDPHHVNARFLRGVVYLCLEDFESAGGDLRLLDTSVKNGALSAALGHIHDAGLKDKASAVGYYNQAIDLAFNSAAVWNNLAWCYHRLADFDSAENCLDKALAVDPQFQHAIQNRVRLELARATNSKKPVSESICERALSTAPQDPYMLLDVATAFAWSATCSSGADDRSRFEGRCLECCELAVKYGLAPKQLKQVSSYDVSLTNNPMFKELIARPAPTVSRPLQVDLIVNPVAHLELPPDLTTAIR